MGDKHVLLYFASTPGGDIFSAYVVGDYVDNCLIPEAEGTVGPLRAPSAMATRTLLDDRGRRMAFSQLGGEHGREAMLAAGASGALSLPWELTLADDLTLGVAPVEEVCSTGQPDWSARGVKLAHDEPFRPDGLAGDALAIVAEIDVGRADEVALKVLASPEGDEETVVLFDARRGRVSLDRSCASVKRDHCGQAVHDWLTLGDKEMLRLHVFVDRTIVEVFANGRACVFGRVPPPREDSVNVSLVARGGDAQLLSLRAWTKPPVPVRDAREA